MTSQLTSMANLLQEVLELRRQRKYPEMEQLILANGDVRNLETALALELWFAWNHQKRTRDALALSTRLAASAEEFYDLKHSRRARLYYAISLSTVGRITEAEAELDKCINLEPEATDKHAIEANNVAGILLSKRGLFDHAAAAYGRALTGWQSLGVTLGVAAVNHNLGILYTDQGSFEIAEQHFLAAWEYYSQSGTTQEDIFCNTARALAVLGLGDLERAGSMAKHSFQRCMALGNEHLLGEVNRVAAKIALVAGRLEEARRACLESMDVAKNLSDKELQAQIEELLAEISEREGRSDQACALLRSALQYRRESGSGFYVQKINDELSRLSQLH